MSFRRTNAGRPNISVPTVPHDVLRGTTMNFTAQKPAQLLLTADAKHDLSYLKFCPTFIATVKSQSVPLCSDFSSDRRFSSRELETFKFHLSNKIFLRQFKSSHNSASCRLPGVQPPPPNVTIAQTMRLPIYHQ